MVFLCYYLLLEHLTVQVKYVIFGNLMVGVFLLMMLFNLICGIIAIYTLFIEWSRNANKKNSGKIVIKNKITKKSMSPKIKLGERGKLSPKWKIELGNKKSGLMNYSIHRYGPNKDLIVNNEDCDSRDTESRQIFETAGSTDNTSQISRNMNRPLMIRTPIKS